MLREEFETITGFDVTGNEYDSIEKGYNNGNIDKHEFCEQWVKNGGIGEVLKARAEGDVEVPYVRRYTNKELIAKVIEQVKKAGEFVKAEKILDYYLPNAKESWTREEATFTECEFNVHAVADFGGSEGIYLNVWLKGKFDESGREGLDIATFKTLHDDLNAMKIMSELGGIINFFLSQFVNKNIKSFFSDSQLKHWEIERAKREYKEWISQNSTTTA